MYTQIQGIIPHRPPMVMIDGYKRLSPNTGMAVKTFGPNDYACRDGRVMEAFLIEAMAQTVAAHQGYEQLGTDDPTPPPGMLVTVDAFECFHSLSAGDTIDIHIDHVGDVGGFQLIQGRVDRGGCLIAQGEFKIFSPPKGEDTP